MFVSAAQHRFRASGNTSRFNISLVSQWQAKLLQFGDSEPWFLSSSVPCRMAPCLSLLRNIDFVRLAARHVSTFRLSPSDKLKFGDSEPWFLSSPLQCRMAPFLTLLLNIDFVRLAVLHASTFRLSRQDRALGGNTKNGRANEMFCLICWFVNEVELFWSPKRAR